MFKSIAMSTLGLVLFCAIFGAQEKPKVTEVASQRELPPSAATDLSAEVLSFLNDPFGCSDTIEKLGVRDLVVHGTLDSVECRLDVFEGDASRFFILSIRVGDEGAEFSLQGSHLIPVKWKQLGMSTKIVVLTKGRRCYHLEAGVWRADSTSVVGGRECLVELEKMRRDYVDFMTFKSEVPNMRWTIRFGKEFSLHAIDAGDLRSRLRAIINEGRPPAEQVEFVAGKKVTFATAGRFIPLQVRAYER